MRPIAITAAGFEKRKHNEFLFAVFVLSLLLLVFLVFFFFGLCVSSSSWVGVLPLSDRGNPSSFPIRLRISATIIIPERTIRRELRGETEFLRKKECHFLVSPSAYPSSLTPTRRPPSLFLRRSTKYPYPTGGSGHNELFFFSNYLPFCFRFGRLPTGFLHEF